uniref:Uncharacterized protein n=1 Tax=Globodera rostochiensis TaxID=31243 RepID=A0A914I9V1_GLORO
MPGHGSARALKSEANSLLSKGSACTKDSAAFALGASNRAAGINQQAKPLAVRISPPRRETGRKNAAQAACSSTVSVVFAE